jgi:hypothetical protein
VAGLLSLIEMAPVHASLSLRATRLLLFAIPGSPLLSVSSAAVRSRTCVLRGKGMFEFVCHISPRKQSAGLGNAGYKISKMGVSTQIHHPRKISCTLVSFSRRVCLYFGGAPTDAPLPQITPNQHTLLVQRVESVIEPCLQLQGCEA